jgi:hypothetical protein
MINESDGVKVTVWPLGTHPPVPEIVVCCSFSQPNFPFIGTYFGYRRGMQGTMQENALRTVPLKRTSYRAIFFLHNCFW